MEQTWRWYDLNDPVSLSDVRQAGATGIVTALYHISNGEIWSVEEILERREIVEKAGLVWSVVESVPIHEDIKTHMGQYDPWISNYQQTLRNLAQCGIYTICYNFMLVLDWTCIDLEYELPDGSKVLYSDQIEFAVFELHILKRPGAEADYTTDEIAQAGERFATMSEEDKVRLTRNIIAGLPGAEEDYTLNQFRSHLTTYQNIDKAALREHFVFFLRAIIPVAEEVGICMAVHPDDPPRPVLDLSRTVSTIEDTQWMVETVNSMASGFTMCTGSYGVCTDNDLVDMIKQSGPRIHFTHPRSTQREDNPKTFHEVAYLSGDVDMHNVVKVIIEEEERYKDDGNAVLIFMRPDHGYQMPDDLKKKTDPGYSAIGRLKGLAEVRGVELAIWRVFFS